MQRMVLVGALVLASCATTTEVQGTWVTEQRPEKMGRTLVIGLAPDATWAHAFEERMAADLRDAGMQAVALAAVEPQGFRSESAEESLDDVNEIAAREGADSILVGQLVGSTVNVRQSSVRPYAAFGPWWGSAWGRPGFWGGAGMVMAPPAVHTTETWQVETRLFDARGGKRLVWSASLTTRDQPLSAIPDLAEQTREQLKKEELLGPRPMGPAMSSAQR